jgi:hypothetical protein
MAKAGNPKHMDNLKPFKKGDDPRRNLKGAPKKIPNLDVHIADLLDGENGDSKGLIDLLNAMLKEAKDGNTRAAELLLDRAYGKSKQIIEASITDIPFVIERTIKDEVIPKAD